MKEEIEMAPLESEIKVSHKAFIREAQTPFKDSYKMGFVAGTGSYGEVRKCFHNHSKQIRAVKLISKGEIEPEKLNALFAELEILKEMDHPNILKMYEYFQDENRIYMVTEYCTGGEVFDKITGIIYIAPENSIELGSLTEKMAAGIMKQLLSAAIYCHSQGIVHRDLKPENMILESKSESANIKVIDFGSAKAFDPSGKMTAKEGTPYYIAPEVLQGNYDCKCDVWSSGVILYILLVGQPPFDGKNDTEIMKKVVKGAYSMKGELWKNVSKEAKDLVQKMLVKNPKKRISAQEAYKHPWIRLYAPAAELSQDMGNQMLEQMLKSSGTHLKLKLAAKSYIVSQLIDENAKKRYRTVFQTLDESGDGKLDEDELLIGFEQIFKSSFDKEKISRLFKAVDTDGSGEIDYSEFLTTVMDEKIAFTEEHLRETFKMMDKDGGGTITWDEIAEVFGITEGQISKDAFVEIINKIDLDGNGEVDFEEFTTMMTGTF